jgi:2-polyprenyl-3-methyl-5-hydroxy-6-metoxy-1,4-benzoquinol methylase
MLTRMLHLLGADVHAFDFVQQRIDEHRARNPEIHWSCMNVEDWASRCDESSFDIVIASEVLQYVDFEAVAAKLHRTVRPGGRLVIVIPNSDCPIIRRTFQRFDGQYVGISLADITTLTHRVFPNSRCLWRGLCFREDQTMFPYEASAWCDPSMLGEPERANRIQLVVDRHH